MSAADVKFLTIEGRECSGQLPAWFKFRCVNGNRNRHPRLPARECARLLIAEGPHSAAHGVKRDGNNQNGGRAQWDWDGDRDAPTFRPSINCASHCGWHGYIRAGRCVETDGADSPE
jgi:hypothetical protein